MKLLIAEDDDFFRRLLQQVLKSEFNLCVAQDGAEAWRLLQSLTEPVLAILDWVMPGMSGPQLCREARALPETAGAYLILLTAKNSTADIIAGLGSGADDYVTKPFQPEELRARVRIGRRVLELQGEVAEQRAALRESMTRERLLQSQMQSLQAKSTPAAAKAASA
jgi:DNA-binding response OmpR family regulator